MSETNDRLTLRDLPLAVRVVLACFLCSVGLGYFSALINLHFQVASAGEPMPTSDDVIAAYSGKGKMSQFERLLTAHETAPFNGQGSMRSALTERRVGGFGRQVRDKAKKLDVAADDKAGQAKAKREVLKDLDGERVALIAWARAGFPEAAWDADEQTGFRLDGKLKDLQISDKFVNDIPNDGRYARIKSIVEVRCVRCHSATAGGAAGQFPLQEWHEVFDYAQTGATGMSLDKLALTTHVHLLAFSMLYGLTGVIFAFSSYPGLVRLALAPAALLAQVVDISFWWLARTSEPYGPTFAQLIPVTGGVVGLSLALQIVLSLFNLFRGPGKIVVIVLLAAGGAAGVIAKQNIIDPYLTYEKGLVQQVDEKK